MPKYKSKTVCYDELYYDERECAVCGEKYYSKKPTQKYCSTECNKVSQKSRFLEEKKLTDFLIFERDNFKSIYCGKSSIEDGIKLVIEHIYPIKKGGDAKLNNVVTSCPECNGTKATNMLKDENILRLWEEIDKRNKNAGIKHNKELKSKLQKKLQSRISRYKNENC